MGISPEFYPKKILRISPDYFFGNSWEILRTWSPLFTDFEGNLIKELVSRSSWEFLRNFFQEIPKNFQVPFFSNRCLWGSLLLCTALTKSFFLCILYDKNDNTRNGFWETPRNSCRHFHRNFLRKIPGNFRKIVTWEKSTVQT